MRMMDDDGGCSGEDERGVITPGAEVWRVRRFGEKVGDYQMIVGWQVGHGKPAVPETILPPLALIAERDGVEVAFAALYQSYGIGVAFLEWITTRPGTSLSDMRTAVTHIIHAMEECTRGTHGLILGHCEEALAREARVAGFAVTGRDVFCIAKNILQD